MAEMQAPKKQQRPNSIAETTSSKSPRTGDERMNTFDEIYLIILTKNWIKSKTSQSLYKFKYIVFVESDQLFNYDTNNTFIKLKLMLLYEVWTIISFYII